MFELVNVYNFFNGYFKRKFWVLLFFTSISVILETVGVGIIIPLVSLFSADSDSYFFLKLREILAYFIKDITNNEIVITCLILVLVFYVIKNLFLIFYAWFQNTFSNSFINFISNTLFNTYIQQPYSFHLENNSSLLIKNISGEVDALRDIVVNTITLISESLIILAISLLLFYMEPTASVAILFLVFITSFVFLYLTKKNVNVWGKERSFYLGLFTKDLMEGFGGIKDLKILGREKKFLNDFKSNYSLFSNSNRKYNTLAAIPRLLFEFFAISSLVLVSILMIFQDRPQESIIPILSLFAFSAFRLIPSTNKVFNSIQHIRFCLPSILIIKDSLNLKSSNFINENIEDVLLNDSIEIKDLSFSYNPGIVKLSLKNVSFTIQKNSSIGIIGESGSGKSTLVDLLLGLLVPTNGSIFVDGKDLNECNFSLRGWQKNIGYVPQNIYLTDDTILNNIAFGLSPSEIDKEKVVKVIKECQLDEFVSSLNDGLNTLVGERGARLSGGQRQRIGIARALYSNPSILVFDEATSSLDLETESSIISLIENMRNRTVVIVAHRLSTVKHCDFIVKLKKGSILETGSYETVVS